MTIRVSEAQARARFAELFNAAVDNGEVVIIQRSSGKRAAVVDANELENLLETVYLFNSLKYVGTLLSAIKSSIEEGEENIN